MTTVYCGAIWRTPTREKNTTSIVFLPSKLCIYVNVVWTDGRYGVIELHQQRRFGRTFGVEFTSPDLVQYASAFGIPAWRVTQPDEFGPLLRRALEMDTPTLIEVPVDHTENLKLGALAGG